MAWFCKQCSVDLFGEDFKDLATGVPHRDLCEECGGYVLVDEDGACIDPNCSIHGKGKMGAEKTERKGNMCQKCQDLAVKYLGRWMGQEEMYDFLFSNTCFPHGGPDLLEPQLHTLNCIADQCGDIQHAAGILHGMWDLNYALTRDDFGNKPRGWWATTPPQWCEGLEQPAGEE